MVRGMNLFLYFLAFLLCFGAKISNANSGKSVESKRKFISISNKAKEDAVIQCKSDKQNFNKTLKPGEKIRWGLSGETAPTAICHVDLESEGVHGYLSAFVEKECKRECKWRVLDDGVFKLKVAGGEWKTFELKPDEEAARNSDDQHHSCDEEDDDDDDHYDGGKGKQGSGESRSREPSMPALAPASEMKSRARGAKFAPSPMKHGQSKSIPRNSRSPAPAPASTKSMAPPTTKQVKKGRKLKPRNPRSRAPTKAPTPKNRKKKPRAPVAKSAPPPMKQGQEESRPSNYSQSLATPTPAALASTKSRAPSPTKQTKKAQSPMKQGRRKLKPRHPRSPVPVKAPAPKNKKKKSAASIPKPTLPPTQQVKKVSENAKTAPPPMKYSQEISRPRNSRSPASAPAPELPASTISRAPPPTKQTKKAQPPTKQGRRKLKPRHPRSQEAHAPIAISAPPPTNQIMKPDTKNDKTAPTPTTNHDHGNSRHGNFPKWKAPAPAPAASPPENESDAELPPLPRPGSTFYTCIKEDSR